MKRLDFLFLVILMLIFSSCDVANAMFDNITEENKGVIFYPEKVIYTTVSVATSEPAVSQYASGITVFVTKSGKKYHYSSVCAGNNSIEVSLTSAIVSGKDPCKKCVK